MAYPTAAELGHKLDQRVHGLLDRATCLLRDNRGAATAVVAIVLPVLIGFTTLGVETGLWYTIKRQDQSAADAAAIAAAHEIIAGKIDIAADLTPWASAAAADNGYTGIAPQIVYPYSDGTVANGVAVFLQRSETVFGSFFLSSVTIASKAVAVLGVLDDLCVLALATTDTGIEVDSGSDLDATGCAVGANSTSLNAIDVRNSNGSLGASTLVTRGEISLSGTPIDPTSPPSVFNPTPRFLIGANGITDPYAGTLSHAFLVSQVPAVSNSWPAAATPIVPGRYDGGMSFAAGASADLEPGVYFVIGGDFSIASNATVTCTTCSDASGVTIVLTSTDPSVTPVGNVKIANGATVALRAPGAGTLSGLLFIQDPLAVPSSKHGSDSVLAGGPDMKLTGILYFPATKVSFQGNPGATCTLLISSRVLIKASASFAASGCASARLGGAPVVYTAALVE